MSPGEFKYYIQFLWLFIYNHEKQRLENQHKVAQRDDKFSNKYYLKKTINKYNQSDYYKEGTLFSFFDDYYDSEAELTDSVLQSIGQVDSYFKKFSSQVQVAQKQYAFEDFLKISNLRAFFSGICSGFTVTTINVEYVKTLIKIIFELKNPTEDQVRALFVQLYVLLTAKERMEDIIWFEVQYYDTFRVSYLTDKDQMLKSVTDQLMSLTDKISEGDKDLTFLQS